MRFDVSGRWTGEYAFDQVDAGPPVMFESGLRSSWFGRFSGVVQDGPSGMPQPGRVSGWARGRRVTFKKHMPVLMFRFEGRPVTLAEYLAATGNARVISNVRHPTIQYEGRLTDDGALHGVWRSERHVVSIPGVMFLRLAAATGTWWATRSAGHSKVAASALRATT